MLIFLLSTVGRESSEWTARAIGETKERLTFSFDFKIVPSFLTAGGFVYRRVIFFNYLIQIYVYFHLLRIGAVMMKFMDVQNYKE